jgi:hypothetical protein
MSEKILKMIPCDGPEIRMGGECNLPRKPDGIYYLKTNNRSPFNLDHEKEASQCVLL